MTRLRLLVSICCALATVMAVCDGQTTITPEQAMDAVRAFEGDPVLQLQNWELKEGEWNDAPYYDINEVESLRSSWTIEWSGGTIKLSAKIRIVDGRLMVPSGLLDILKSASAPAK